MTTSLENRFNQKKQTALLGGGAERIKQQENFCKKTARQRLDLLLDANSFEETDLLVTSPFLEKKFLTDGVICGFGKINDRIVAIYAQDFTIKGGSLGKAHAQKIIKIMDLAAKIGCPIIGIVDSGGARIDEGIHALAGYGEIFLRNTRYSGIIPQLSVILGPCAGGAVYSPALTDFIFTTDKISQLFITGPNVIQQVLHQTISKEELGGARIHNSTSGVAHFLAHSEEECFAQVKQLLSFLPQNYLTEAVYLSNKTPKKNGNTATLVPQNLNQSYDIKSVIEEICDTESFFEVQELFAQNIVIGFGRIEGKSIGIIANQPLCNAGSIDIDASCKAARFIQFCNNFGIPLLTLVDVPGFLPGIEQEHNGIIRHGAKLLYAYAHSTVPKITIILRKAFGGAYLAMASKHLGTDFNYAWPQAQIAVLGATAAITILDGKKFETIENQENKLLKIKEAEQQYESEFLNPFTAAEFGYIDAIIEPNQTRNHIIKSLEILHNKVENLPAKTQGNIPL